MKNKLPTNKIGDGFGSDPSPNVILGDGFGSDPSPNVM